MSTAQDSVLLTPELLELILCHLPIRHLLVTAPLVCKYWRDLTLTPALQRALFFEPDNSTSPSIRNPLLEELFPPFFATLEDSSASNWFWPGSAKRIMAMPWSHAPQAFKRKEASWRRMLVVQPPARSIVVTEYRHARGGNFERDAVLKDLLPVRMGFLYDLTVPFVDRVASSFRIRSLAPELGGDLALDVSYTAQCCTRSNREIDSKFDSEAREQVPVEFGQFVREGTKDAIF
ncbi:putative f-box domain protein [Favolaschia claudopus]|uniref:F-box domain protein n=1 Tax=Favolaschia claudopus TaxID=2862362 RepID=A0AAW0CJ85_9AGAR